MCPETTSLRRQRGVSDAKPSPTGQRIQKVMAAAGLASRRHCEELVTAGRVTVNGQAVTELPAWVDPDRDRIAVDGRMLFAAVDHQYVLLHKPRNIISTAFDPEGRTTVVDLLHPKGRRGKGGGRSVKINPGRGRLFPVGRLDADSTGLILLTNDGELANRLTHPRYGVPKQYRVSILGTLGERDIEKLTRGLILAQPDHGARKARVSSVRILRRQRDKLRQDRTMLLITLREGQNREIRRMLVRLGYKVRRLQRVAIGPLSLKGLASGQCRELTSVERRAVLKAVGLRRPHGRKSERSKAQIRRAERRSAVVETANS